MAIADTVKSAVNNGISVELSISSADAAAKPASAQKLQEGDNVTIRFRLKDAVSGQPFSGPAPSAWIDRLEQNDPTKLKKCDEAVKTFLEGSLFSRAELDLNSYYVLALNEDPTITVVDPLFGYGNSKLLALIDLKSAGDDWVLTRDHARLFVSMPAAGQIAVIDTENWRVVTNLEAGPHVNRLLIQPDDHYLWAATDSGVTVFSLLDLKVAGRMATGAGAHWIAAAQDSRFVFVSNAEAGTVSLIDVAKMEKVQDFKTGLRPGFLAYSELSRLAYVANQDDGTVVGIDAARRKSFPPIQLRPGISQVRFAPGGRYGFAVNPATDQVFIFDAASNQLLHTAKVEKGPDSIMFSEKLAYVRHRGSDAVLMIPLDVVASGAESIGLADFTGGRFPPGKMANPSSADGIVQAPGELAVLVANPEDRMIYFYKEGMAAPMGSFSNYSRKPRAVQVVDKSLKQQSPGVFQTTIKMPRPGQYRIAFLLDSPRVVQCFDPIEVAPNTALADANQPSIRVVFPQTRQAQFGKPFRVQFEVRDRISDAPVEGLQDIRIMAVKQPGSWQTSEHAESVGRGVYEAQFTPPEAGVYHIYFECLSHKLALTKSGYLFLDVVGAQGAGIK